MSFARNLEDSLNKTKSLHNYNRWIFENIERYIGGDVLEIGCGTGIHSGFIMEKSRNFTGLEIERGFAGEAKKKFKGEKNARIICGDFMKASFGKKFDTVILLNVLEHIKDDAAAVKKIHGLLKKNGRIITMVPAWQAAYGKIDEIHGHYRRYSGKRLREIYAKAGFGMERIFYMNFIGAFGWLINSKLFSTGVFPGNQAKAVNFLVPAMKFFEGIVKPPIGQSLIAIGRK